METKASSEPIPYEFQGGMDDVITALEDRRSWMDKDVVFVSNYFKLLTL